MRLRFEVIEDAARVPPRADQVGEMRALDPRRRSPGRVCRVVRCVHSSLMSSISRLVGLRGFPDVSFLCCLILYDQGRGAYPSYYRQHPPNPSTKSHSAGAGSLSGAGGGLPGGDA